MNESLIRLEIRESAGPGRGAVAIVALDDPAHRNMLSAPMVRDLVSAIDAIEGDADVGAVVVTGTPPAFCAGADLAGLTSLRGEAIEEAEAGRRLREIYEGFLRVARCRLPTVAAVNGAAVGAGMNLALACDVRIASRRARFDTRFLDLGLHPGGGHTFMLSRIAGPQVAAAMLLFGERFDGPAAVEHGLAFRCVEEDRLMDEAVELAARAASTSRALAVRAKQTLQEGAKLVDRDEAVALELEAQLWSMGEPFFAERLQQLRSRISSADKTER